MTVPIQVAESSGIVIERLKRRYKSVFEYDERRQWLVVQVPLRVCPLGAHSDHQAGTVTGLTIDRSVWLVGQAHDRAEVTIFSEIFGQSCRVEFENIPDKTTGDWGNYARGAIHALRRAEAFVSRGFNAVVCGEMPVGGLSSSAAVTIAYLKALEQVNNLSLSRLETILLVRATENGYLGLHNGIMDQSVILSGRKNELTCINCASHEISNVAQERAVEPWEILVVYSGLTRQLTGTPFNQRVAECHEAARALLAAAGLPISEKPLLGEIDPKVFSDYEKKLPEVLGKRARHFFTEAARVRQGVELWASGDIAGFGALITQSGKSSIVNFESGSPALISLYDILASLSGVYGSRFCGGGFQGCCFALIDPRKRDEIAEALHRAYVDKHPELQDSYSIHFCQSSDSVSVRVEA